MPHIMWYYGLIVLGTAISAFTLYHKRRYADWLAYLLFATGASWTAESFIMFLFNGYAYQPGVYADPFAENILGHIIANTGLWATTAVLVMFLHLSFVWIGAIAAAFMLIEVLFVHYGAYSQHWWNTYMTGVGILIFMAVMKRWYMSLERNRQPWLRGLTMWTIAWVIIQTPTSLLMILGKLLFRVDWYENIYRNGTLFSGFLYHAGMATVFTLMVGFARKRYWSYIPFFVFIIGDAILMDAGILVFQGGWTMLHLLPIRAISLALFIWFDRFTLKGSDAPWLKSPAL